MESAVPFYILNLDSMGFRDLIYVPTDEFFPRFGIIEMQTFSILTAQTDYLCPDNAVVIGDPFRNGIKVNRHIKLCKQSVRAELFNAGTFGNIVDQAL